MLFCFCNCCCCISSVYTPGLLLLLLLLLLLQMAPGLGEEAVRGRVVPLVLKALASDSGAADEERTAATASLFDLAKVHLLCCTCCCCCCCYLSGAAAVAPERQNWFCCSCCSCCCFGVYVQAVSAGSRLMELQPALLDSLKDSSPYVLTRDHSCCYCCCCCCF